MTLLSKSVKGVIFRIIVGFELSNHFWCVSILMLLTVVIMLIALRTSRPEVLVEEVIVKVEYVSRLELNTKRRIVVCLLASLKSIEVR